MNHALKLALVTTSLFGLSTLLSCGGGDSGEGGAGGTKPANSCARPTDCTDPALPQCDLDTYLCVPCLTNEHCPTNLPVCDNKSACVECATSAHCPMEKPACADNICVECFSDDDCGPVKPRCNVDTKLCVQCFMDSDCPGTSPVCTSNTCM